jgi:F-type H+-transporting ATPase subunit a
VHRNLGALVLGLSLETRDDGLRADVATAWAEDDPAADDHADPHAAAGDAHGEEPNGDAAHGDAAHGDDHGDHGTPHLPSILDVVIGAIPGGADSATGKTLKRFSPSIFGVIAALLIAALAQAASRNLTLVPGRLQNVGEIIIGGLSDFIVGTTGPEGKRFVPFLGTLFIYIWIMNMLGLVPLGFAATSNINMTAALALTVFGYVMWTNLRMNGLGGFLFHMAGEPRDAIGWAMAPLMFPLHIIGELAKPFSLAVRLFGNIFGEETLIAVFVSLGVLSLAFLDPLPIGIPFHIPFVFLSILLGTIQALVFMLLSTIYFVLAMPHGHSDGDGDH